MKKLLHICIALFLMLGFCIPCGASYGAVRTIFDGTLINATATSTSDPILIKSGGYFGVWYKATSAGGTADVKFEVQMSHDATSANFVVPDAMADIVTNLTDETVHVESFSPPPMKYMRIKCTGNAANPADTVVTMYLFYQSS